MKFYVWSVFVYGCGSGGKQIVGYISGGADKELCSCETATYVIIILNFLICNS